MTTWQHEAEAADALRARVIKAEDEVVRLKTTSPTTSELVVVLRRMVDEYENYSDERSGEPSCPVCTDGATPNHLNKGPCAYHQAKALLATA